MGNSSFLQNRFEQFSELSNILFSHLEWAGNYKQFRSLNIVGAEFTKVNENDLTLEFILYIFIGVPLLSGAGHLLLGIRRKSFA